MIDEGIEQAVLALERHDGRTVVAALEQPFARREIEAAARLVAAVTFDALVDQDLADMAREDILTFRQPFGVVGRQLGSGGAANAARVLRQTTARQRSGT